MTTEWYMKMAKAITRRDHALMMIGKWQEKVQAAEAEIQQLASEQSMSDKEPGPDEAAEQV